ncbi:Wzz/FepE/Etk N-terminal domain-containing protein [Streptococcus cuniculipharyngis]|uniref:Capsular polysaccharide biosynthesis protein CpsC n=1 Tax=Streptococcus cuniculipharyngis TaxID=1562651 RepID=A0A5C5SBC4_9STRE|nr:Wzz/FepE/Etk N-terminal domain-containing protein [Streptococcus cuniculipharyngis]TWS97650.1 capsular biosynthesis protein CpsC [Streptococcus cuniculipharyngis]
MNTQPSQTAEIDVLYLLKKLWSNKFLITLIAVVGALSGLLISLFLITPEYTSVTRIYVVNQNSNSNNITTQDLQAGDYLVNDYKEIIRSNDVLSAVIANNGLSMDVEDLLKKVKVSIPTDTRVISILVEDKDPQLASSLANSIREIAAEKIKSVTRVEDVTTLEVAEPSEEPSSPNIKRNVVLGALVGGVLAVISVLLMEILDDRVKRPEDVEEVLGITLLGVVPDTDKL